MYGIVNQAIKGMVLESFGQDSWDKIKNESGIQENVFLNNESYDDQITYKLAGAASKVLDVPVTDVLEAFGEYWILKTGLEKYDSLMKSGGASLAEFLINLPNFHSRVMLMYPELTPPEFKIEKKSDSHFYVHYFSQRQGLTHFMIGLLKGLAKMFEVAVEVKHLSSESDPFTHDVFEINW